ncbi:MAG: thiamine phosphate synthase [Janthinobacterium lividum]
MSDFFWPPDAARQATTIQLLEQWPEFIADREASGGVATFRLCTAWPEAPRERDLLIMSADPDAASAPRLAARVDAVGGGLITAGAGRVGLRYGDASYALLGDLPEAHWPALAAFLACNFAPHDALCLAMAWRPAASVGARVQPGDGIADGAAVRSGEGAWPDDLSRFPRIADLPAPPPRFARGRDRIGLYPVVPSADWIERLAPLGLGTLQLRVKSDDADHVRSEVARAVSAASAYDVPLYINDHWQAAIDAGAYGVHLGQEDLQTADLAAISAAGLRLGLSTHGYYEILLAQHFSPSYIALGAVFPTTTKAMPTAPQGLAKLVHYVRLLDGRVPHLAIGGIDLARLPAVRATGAGGAAFVRAVTEAKDLAMSVQALKRAFDDNGL